MEKLNVFYASSDVFALSTGVSMTSLFMNNTDIESITVYVLPDNFSEKDLDRMKELADQYGREVVILDSEEIMRQFDSVDFPAWRGSRIIYGRAFCASLVPDTVDRLIAFDSDTLIVDSLRPLLEMDLKGNCVAMVQESGVETKLLDPPENYNSGCTVYDVKKWRDENWRKKTIDFLETYPYQLILADQEIINQVYRGSILKLPLQYNFFAIHRICSDDTYCMETPPNYYSREEIAYAREHPVILHSFRILGERVWNKGTPHPDKEIFDKYLLESPWKDYEKEPANKSAFFTIEQFLYRVLPEKLFFRMFNFAKKLSMKRRLSNRVNKDHRS